MALTAMSFKEKIAEARRYEKALAAWLQRVYGAYILPTYDYSGLQDNKAPKLLSTEKDLVIPDLLICRNGRTTWVECKWKTEAVLHRNSGDVVTGINARHYDHYLKVKDVSGCPVVLMFLHVKEQEMRGEEVGSMPPIHHRYDGPKMGYGGMVFWEYGKLRKWCSLKEVMPND